MRKSFSLNVTKGWSWVRKKVDVSKIMESCANGKQRVC